MKILLSTPKAVIPLQRGPIVPNLLVYCITDKPMTDIKRYKRKTAKDEDVKVIAENKKFNRNNTQAPSAPFAL